MSPTATDVASSRPGWRFAVFLSVPLVVFELLILTRWGWFRDELYYMASTRHLAWGYVDHPPLSIAVLGLVRMVAGPSLVAMAWSRPCWAGRP